jgi:membrane fusion protein (multidrug efflux system)
MQYEKTDNAQIEGDIYPVISRIAGKVAEVRVRDNQMVARGDTLLTLDRSDELVRLNMMAAELQSAQAAVSVAMSQADAARAAVSAAEATNRKEQSDLQRYSKLLKQEVISPAEFDGVKARAEAAAAQLLATRNRYQAAQAELPLKQADVLKRQATLHETELKLSYTALTAPANGRVAKKNVHVGQYVAPGQQLIALVGSNDLWVVANFKETQLEHLAPNQAVIIEVDAYPWKEFKGTIESLSSGTGAKFALLPPDNASGNFVKVTQRVPVKILFTEKLDKRYPLAAGMNVTVAVKVK